MGKNIGWIAIDATIQEYDYVDAGHIKLGIGATFQPENMEILDYRIAGGDTTSEISGIPPEYENIIGPYTNFDNRNVHDSYGEALRKNGDVENAIINYQKSVELNPDNEHAKEMLEELTVETNE